MKRKTFTKALMTTLVVAGLFSCGSVKEESISVTYEGNESALQFGKDEILKAGSRHNFKEGDGGYSITVKSLNADLGNEAYVTEVNGKNITIEGGDKTGQLYGLLEVADYIKANGNLSDFKGGKKEPRFKERMLKFNAPLDMRCPSYTDTGANAQEEIKDVWDLSFWQEYFDAAARNRFNAVNLWSLNPFPVMTKVEGYEDVALDDVWKTTLPFDASYSGNCANAVRDEHWENYEVIKKITIDEKIKFFNKVIDLAHDRGIKFYISSWNVYTFGEHGKYGITSSLDNKVTKDYYKKAVKSLLNSYPNLDGMGVCTGEYMSTKDVDTGSLDDSSFKEQWLFDTYGESIKESLNEKPRDFKVIHRMHFTDYESMKDIWKDLPCEMDISTKYSSDHMFVNGVHRYADENLDAIPDGSKSLLELRNNDFYNLRWGDYSFISNYFNSMNKLNKVSGLVFGSDGYVDGREYFYQDNEFNGTLSLDKHFTFYSLIGQLSYNKDLDENYFRGLFKDHFSSIDSKKADLLFEAMQEAGKIAPTISAQYFNDGDANWYVETNGTHPNTFGYLNIKRWVNADNAHPYGGCVSISKYCTGVKNNNTDFGDLKTPVWTADKLSELASNTLSKLSNIGVKEDGKLAKEFNSLARDQKAFAQLGNFYSNKLKAVIALREYNDLNKVEKKDEASQLIKESISNYAEYASTFHENYKPMWLSWTGLSDINAMAEKAREDQKTVDTWTIRPY